MLKIRLSRLGKTNSPFYRVVVIEESAKNSGMPHSTLGTWFPATNKVDIDKKELENWVKKGAIVSPAVKKLISK
jgi:small subunit ribosomal protein S16